MRQRTCDVGDSQTPRTIRARVVQTVYPAFRVPALITCRTCGGSWLGAAGDGPYCSPGCQEEDRIQRESAD